MKEYIKSIPFTTLIITFFFTCGGLYLLGFWSYFDIDISNIVNLTDIPKSFIMPFAVSNGMFFIWIAAHFLVIRSAKFRETLGEAKTNKKNFFLKGIFDWLFNSEIFFSIAGAIISFYYISYNNSSLFWLIAGYSVSLGIIQNLIYNESIQKKIPYPYLRFYLLSILIYTPIMSFSIGKAKGINVYTNKEIKCVTPIIDSIKNTNQNITSFKLLGFLGDKAIISSLDNEKIIVLNQGDFSGFVLTKPENK